MVGQAALCANRSSRSRVASFCLALGIDVPSHGLVVSTSTVVVCLVVGVGVRVLSALSPARKAAKVPPIAAMQLVIAGSTGYGSKQRIFVGLGVLGLGVAALLVGLFAGVGQPVTVVGAGALLVFSASRFSAGPCRCHLAERSGRRCRRFGASPGNSPARTRCVTGSERPRARLPS